MQQRVCEIDGCDRPYFAKGKCQMHYARVLRGKPVGPAHPVDRHGYSVERDEYLGAESQCEECGTGFQQRKMGSPKRYCSTICRQRGQTRASRERGYARPAQPPCTVEGCDKPNLARGYCAMHLERVRKYGDPGEAESRHHPGEWRPNEQGYMIRYLDGKHEAQHRVVMEQVLGRPLWRDETPHHKNGDRSDNRIENLELWSTHQPAGQRVADKLAYAREIIERYENAPAEIM